MANGKIEPIVIPDGLGREGLLEFSDALDRAKDEVTARLGTYGLADEVELPIPPELAIEIPAPDISYGRAETRLTRLPTTVINRFDSPGEKADKTLGFFFSLRNPAWDRDGGADTVFILEMTGGEHPNPTFSFIGVDSRSKMHGHVLSMFATDFGLRPCPYGNHITARKTSHRRINPAPLFRDGEFRRGAKLRTRISGSELLIGAIVKHQELQEAETTA